MLKISFDQKYIYPLEENHRFPMIKYELIPEQLIRENTCTDQNFFSPNKISDHDVLLTHEESYFKKLVSQNLSKSEQRPIGFPMSEELVEREKIISQGTIDCALYSLKNNVSMNIAGGTHHAFYDRGEAFCMLNDQAIAANYLIENKLCNKILIVDLDVHQGNGTASIFSNNKNVFTLSFHGKNNYPFKKENSNIDIEFENGVDDKFYLQKLKNILPKTLEEFQPEFIFYLSGVDVLENDRLGKLSLSLEGCKERDRYVLSLCKQNNIPVQISMGGGYSFELKNIIEAHSNTFRLAQEIFF
jgi:acetoin utilization deacetylase AcuC-like enzyme